MAVGELRATCATYTLYRLIMTELELTQLSGGKRERRLGFVRQLNIDRRI